MSKTDPESNLSTLWERLLKKYPLERSRLDRAILEGYEGNADRAPAVEIGYGSRTIRVRVFNGHEMIGLVDFNSDGWTKADQQMKDLSVLLKQVGINPR